MKPLKIIKAKLLEDYKLSIVFSDKKEQIVDFEPFLKQSSHMEVRKYLEKKYFKKFHIKNGDLMWGDFDLIFPIADLYKNQILKTKKTSIAV